MNFPRNSFLLLLRNEFRLYLRGLKGMSVVFLIISQVLLHVIALAVAWGTSGRSVPTPPNSALFMLSGGLLAMFMLMTSRALGSAVQTLYTRGDLDLLLSSPVDRRSVIGRAHGSHRADRGAGGGAAGLAIRQHVRAVRQLRLVQGLSAGTRDGNARHQHQPCDHAAVIPHPRAAPHAHRGAGAGRAGGHGHHGGGLPAADAWGPHPAPVPAAEGRVH